MNPSRIAFKIESLDDSETSTSIATSDTTTATTAASTTTDATDAIAFDSNLDYNSSYQSYYHPGNSFEPLTDGSSTCTKTNIEHVDKRKHKKKMRDNSIATSYHHINTHDICSSSDACTEESSPEDNLDTYDKRQNDYFMILGEEVDAYHDQVFRHDPVLTDKARCKEYYKILEKKGIALPLTQGELYNTNTLRVLLRRRELEVSSDAYVFHDSDLESEEAKERVIWNSSKDKDRMYNEGLQKDLFLEAKRRTDTMKAAILKSDNAVESNDERLNDKEYMNAFMQKKNELTQYYSTEEGIKKVFKNRMKSNFACQYATHDKKASRSRGEDCLTRVMSEYKNLLSDSVFRGKVMLGPEEKTVFVSMCCKSIICSTCMFLYLKKLDLGRKARVIEAVYFEQLKVRLCKSDAILYRSRQNEEMVVKSKMPNSYRIIQEDQHPKVSVMNLVDLENQLPQKWKEIQLVKNKRVTFQILEERVKGRYCKGDFIPCPICLVSKEGQRQIKPTDEFTMFDMESFQEYEVAANHLLKMSSMVEAIDKQNKNVRTINNLSGHRSGLRSEVGAAFYSMLADNYIKFMGALMMDYTFACHLNDQSMMWKIKILVDYVKEQKKKYTDSGRYIHWASTEPNMGGLPSNASIELGADYSEGGQNNDHKVFLLNQYTDIVNTFASDVAPLIPIMHSALVRLKNKMDIIEELTNLNIAPKLNDVISNWERFPIITSNCHMALPNTTSTSMNYIKDIDCIKRIISLPNHDMDVRPFLLELENVTFKSKQIKATKDAVMEMSTIIRIVQGCKLDDPSAVFDLNKRIEPISDRLFHSIVGSVSEDARKCERRTAPKFLDTSEEEFDEYPNLAACRRNIVDGVLNQYEIYHTGSLHKNPEVVSKVVKERRYKTCEIPSETPSHSASYPLPINYRNHHMREIACASDVIPALVNAFPHITIRDSSIANDYKVNPQYDMHQNIINMIDQNLIDHTGTDNVEIEKLPLKNHPSSQTAKSCRRNQIISREHIEQLSIQGIHNYNIRRNHHKMHHGGLDGTTTKGNNGGVEAAKDEASSSPHSLSFSELVKKQKPSVVDMEHVRINREDAPGHFDDDNLRKFKDSFQYMSLRETLERHRSNMKYSNIYNNESFNTASSGRREMDY